MFVYRPGMAVSWLVSCSFIEFDKLMRAGNPIVRCEHEKRLKKKKESMLINI